MSDADIPWTYIAADHGVAWRDLGDGRQESKLAMALTDAERAAALPYVAPPAPVPETISRGQFIRQLAKGGVIAADEATAWATSNKLPAALADLIAGLPADQQADDRLLVLTAQSFARHHPLTEALATAEGWAADQTDAFWRAAAGL